MNKKTIVKKKYEMQIAGRLWEIPKITFVERKGRTFLDQKEIKKWNDAVANAICSEDSALTIEEFKFLVNVADRKYSEVAEMLRIDASTITKWIKKDDDLSYAYSVVLRLWFWAELFEPGRTEALSDILLGNGEQAIAEKKVSPIKSA